MTTSGRILIAAIVAAAVLLAGCAPVTPEAAPTAQEAAQPEAAATGPDPAAERVPLGDALPGLEPQDVWQNFYAITQIPRPSGHVEQMRAYLVQFGEGLGLETTVDEAGNVLIRKPAAPGLEGRKGVVLQAHMDMVAVKSPDSAHDFLADPIPAFAQGGWIVTDGTTLGADNGIGMALAMAVLQSATPSGPVEALFTVDEETTMSGANGLQPGVLQGAYLINLDQEKDGEFVIGSAGGVTADVAVGYAQAEVPAGLQGYEVAVSGLTGGHSGADIDKGRGHALKLLARLLRDASAPYGLRLAALAGGDAPNIIPAHATALVGVPEAQADAFLEAVRSFEATVKAELAAVEPGLSVTATPADLPAQVMDEAEQHRLIAALDGSPQGVQRMSDAVAGLVESSLNLGVVQAQEGAFLARWTLRSAVDTALADMQGRLASVWRLAGEEVAYSSGYPGWAPDPGSSLVQLMEQAYADLYGQEAVATAIHAGLECGTVLSKYPDMEAISVGPTMFDVHSTSERLEIATVQRAADLLAEALSRMPQAAAPAGEWQTFSNAAAGYSLQIPPGWVEEAQPDQNAGLLHTTSYSGPEGGVEMSWGTGFGGACPSGTSPLQLAEEEVQACHITAADGTQMWTQIYYVSPDGTTYGARAWTNDAEPASADLLLDVLATLAFMPPAAPAPGGEGAALANPASQNCVAQGGTLSIVERGDGGQYGICFFEDNRQCEEWALLRGDCPVGGVKVTGYATDAATYCAITGGSYAITGSSGAADEQGTCTLPGGAVCDAWEYYNGACTQ